jgi:hypothetical protein
MLEGEQLMTADSDDARRSQAAIDAHARADHEEIERLRRLTLEQRAELLRQACEAAEEARQARIESGLGDVQPDPWPTSTWEFLRKCAAQYDATHANAERP